MHSIEGGVEMTRILSRKKIILTFFLLISMTQVVCNLPGTSPTPDLRPTQAAQTVAARLTQAAIDTPSAPPPPQATTPASPPTLVPTLVPTAVPPSPTFTHTPTEAATEIPCDRASFTKDVNYPDGTDVEKGAAFTKTWRLRNTGTCSWTSGYSIVFNNGDSMGGPASQQLTAGTVAPGQSIDVSMNLVAPNSTGTYRGVYRLRNSTNVLFSIENSATDTFWVEIDVVEPAPSVVASGHLDIRQTYGADLDVGANDSPDFADMDMWFEAVSAVEKYLTPWDTAKFKKMGGIPSLADCQAASLSSNKIPLGLVSVGSWFCYETDLGNVGRFEVEGLTGGSPQTLTIDFKTWEIP
jgi:hypothetical protein